MHPAAALFLTRCHIPHPAPRVFEVGSANHNGRARDYLPVLPAKWVGFDLLAGDGVDVVGDATVTLYGRECDVMLSTEVLEHAPQWEALLGAMCATVRSGGWLVVTCAGPGREPHGANGGPLLPDEHYANVAVADIERVATLFGFTTIAAEQINGDSRYFARREAV